MIGWWTFWQDWRNQVDFTLRQTLHPLSWGKRRLPDLAHLRQHMPTPRLQPQHPKANSETLLQQAQPLMRCYPGFLQQPDGPWPAMVLADSFNLLQWLDETLNADWLAPDTSAWHWLDVGSKTWSYLPGLAAYLQQHRPNYRLTGVELDGYRLYTDGYTRQQYAQALAAFYPQAQYRLADACTVFGPFHGISLLLPFVLPETHRAWGLPTPFFQPATLLRHLVLQLAEGGVLLIINLTKAEQEVQQTLIRELDLPSDCRLSLCWQGPVTDHWLDYGHWRQGSVYRKEKVDCKEKTV